MGNEAGSDEEDNKHNNHEQINQEDEFQVVLHEDKKYYPEMDEVYPDAENLVMEEDI